MPRGPRSAPASPHPSQQRGAAYPCPLTRTCYISGIAARGQSLIRSGETPCEVRSGSPGTHLTSDLGMASWRRRDPRNQAAGQDVTVACGGVRGRLWRWSTADAAGDMGRPGLGSGPSSLLFPASSPPAKEATVAHRPARYHRALPPIRSVRRPRRAAPARRDYRARHPPRRHRQSRRRPRPKPRRPPGQRLAPPPRRQAALQAPPPSPTALGTLPPTACVCALARR